jgi:hypothetical protein
MRWKDMSMLESSIGGLTEIDRYSLNGDFIQLPFLPSTTVIISSVQEDCGLKTQDWTNPGASEILSLIGIACEYFIKITQTHSSHKPQVKIFFKKKSSLACLVSLSLSFKYPITIHEYTIIL